MATIFGNDVASFQGTINYDIYRNSASFIICKATEGVGYRDPQFLRNQSEARRVGIGLGYYHFARPDLGNTPENEAQWFLDTISGLREGELLVLDYEPASQIQAWVDWCKRWLDYVYNKTGCRPLIYLNQSQTGRFNWKTIVDGGYGLWVAAYTYDPNNNNFNTGLWPFAAMQQWTNKQIVAGIPAGAVDGNVFFGDINTFRKYGYHGQTPTPSPTPPSNTDIDNALNILRKAQTDYNFGNLEGTAAALRAAMDKLNVLMGDMNNANIKIRDLQDRINAAREILDTSS